MSTQKPQHELRCVNCDRLLLKHTMKEGLLEVKCPKSSCKSFTRVKIDACNKSVSIEEKIEVCSG